MGDYEKIYKKLSQKMTDEEIAEAMLIPANHEKDDAGKAREEFVKMRMSKRENRTAEEVLLGKLLSLKYQIKKYLKDDIYDEDRTLGFFLKKYVDLSGKSRKNLANDIDVHPSRLSRILNGKETFGKNLAFRLEEHSGGLISAMYWWKLAQKEEEQEVLGSHKKRKIEYAKVKNKLIKI